jgi:cytochrome-b5 reductase
MLQMIRSILGDKDDRTRLSLVFANRREEDILMRGELDELAEKHAEDGGDGRFRVHYVLSRPPMNGASGSKDGSAESSAEEGGSSGSGGSSGGGEAVWGGGTGWIGPEDVGPAHLPTPVDGETMVLVCGQDEFLDTVSGRTMRAPPPPGKKKGPKIQGELTGVLAQVGYGAQHVYKF